MSPVASRVFTSFGAFLRSACHSTLLASLLAAMLLLPGLPMTAQALENNIRYPATFEAMGKFGNVRILGEGRAFIPLWQNTANLFYLDLRGMGDDDSNVEGNFGVAYRHLFGESFILGGYGFFDYRDSDIGDNSFIGGLIGVEALTTNWDFHVNGYIPEGGSHSAPDFDEIVPVFPTIGIQQGRERALWGFDSEIGWRIPFSDNSLFWDTRIYAGGYYFDASGVDEIAGPRGRFEVRFHDPFSFFPRGSRITLGGEVQWDDPRGVQGFGSVALRIPIYNYGGLAPDGSGKFSRLQRRMLDPIQRDVDIITNVKGGPILPVYNPKTGEAVDFLLYTDAEGGGDGKKTNPADIELALLAAGTNGIVVAIGDDPIDTGDNVFFTAQMQNGQILMGGGETIHLEDSQGRSLPYTAFGSRGTLTNISGGLSPFTPVVTAARNNLIAGLDIVGRDAGPGFGGGIGVLADDPGDFMVMDSHFIDLETTGIEAGYVSSTSWKAGIMDNHFEGDFQALDLNLAEAIVDIDISGNKLRGMGGTAVGIGGGAGLARISLSDNSIKGYGLGLGGMLFAGTLELHVDNNDFDAGDNPDVDAQAISFGATGQDIHAQIHDNEADGFTGTDFLPVVDLAFNGSVAGLTEIDVANNSIVAPDRESVDPGTEGGLQEPGVLGLRVVANISPPSSEGETPGPGGPNNTVLDMQVRNNEVRNFEGSPFGDAAVDVQTSAVAGLSVVSVTDNEIVAPHVAPDDDERFGYTGLFVDVNSLEAAEVTVDGNTVEGYSGGGFDDFLAEGERAPEGILPGGIPAVGVAGFAQDLDMVVSNNDIRAPIAEDSSEPTALGTGLAVLGYAEDLQLSVEDNAVDGYAGFGESFNPSTEGNGGQPEGGAVVVGGFGDTVDIEVKGNDITAPTVVEQVSKGGDELEFKVGGTGLLVGSFGKGSEQMDLEVSDNEVDGYLGFSGFFGNEGGFGESAAVVVEASGAETINVAVDDNRIEGDPTFLQEFFAPVGAGLSVHVSSFDSADVSVTNNEVLSYIGYLSGPAVGVEVENGITAEIEVSDNTVEAPDIGISKGGGSAQVGLLGMIVEGDDIVANLEMTVSDNDVEGYAGGAALSSSSEGGPGQTPAAVTLLADSNEDVTVTADGNNITSPDLEDADVPFALSGPGLSIFTTGGDEVDSDALVTVTNHDIDGYTGAPDVAALEVSVDAYNTTVVVGGDGDGNTVTAPDIGGFLGIDVEADGTDVAVVVDDNEVDGYATGLLPNAEQQQEGGELFAVQVNADADDGNSSVSVSGNHVKAPDDLGSTAIEITNTGASGGTAIESNNIDGYANGINATGDHADDGSIVAKKNDVNGVEGAGTGISLLFVGSGFAELLKNSVKNADTGIQALMAGDDSQLRIKNNDVDDAVGVGINVLTNTVGRVDAEIGDNSIKDSDTGFALTAVGGVLDVTSDFDDKKRSNDVDDTNTELDTVGNLAGSIIINGDENDLNP